jgi:hypothetical protein
MHSSRRNCFGAVEKKFCSVCNILAILAIPQITFINRLWEPASLVGACYRI